MKRTMSWLAPALTLVMVIGSGALAASLLVWNAWDFAAAARRFEGWEYLAGKESREEFLRRIVPAYEVTKWANGHLPPDSRIYFAFTGNRVYYSQRNYGYDAFWDGATLMKLFTGGNGADTIKRSLREKGFTHLVLMEGVMRRFANGNNLVPLYEQFIAAPPLYAMDGGILFPLAER